MGPNIHNRHINESYLAFEWNGGMSFMCLFVAFKGTK